MMNTILFPLPEMPKKFTSDSASRFVEKLMPWPKSWSPMTREVISKLSESSTSGTENAEGLTELRISTGWADAADGFTSGVGRVRRVTVNSVSLSWGTETTN